VSAVHRATMPDPFTRLQLQRGAEHLHRLGPRATAELLAELGGLIGGMPCILTLLAEYRERLDPELLRQVGGDRFPPRNVREVPR
jgi:hypothetical protein